MDDIAKNKEILIIEDKGCIITHDGNICSWFTNALSLMNERNRTILGIASKFRVRLPVRDEQLYIINVPALNKMECADCCKNIWR